MRRAQEVRRGRQVLGALLVGAVAMVACTGENDAPVATAPSTTTNPPRPHVDDGVLRIGALIPLNDPIGTKLATSFENAVADLNAAGGVLGSNVVALVEDEGSSSNSAAQATAKLVAAGADAIVGPTSSNTAIGALDEAIASGVVTCSATATALSLDDFPDQGLFFRSIPSDSLQAVAIALEAKSRGASSVAIIHVDDAYGRPYADAVAAALRSPSIQVTTIAVPFGDDDLAGDLGEFAAVGADTGIVLGDGADIARFLEAIGMRDDIQLSRVIVNDAARSPSARQTIAGLDAGFRNRIVGVTPQIMLSESDSSDDNAPFAPQIVDCVNLIALAAAQGRSDSPSVIASNMTSVSSGGKPCQTFAACIELLDAEEAIDYDGPKRITELARGGDPSRAFFNRFGFGDDGSDVYQSATAVG